jgi:hypothetical protein
MQRLDEELLRDGTIIPNNRQYRTRVFIPKDVLRLPKKDPHNLRDNPMAVTQALGEMILIGDQIAYINRVSVTSGGSGEVIPPPTVNREEKTLVLNGDTPQTFILTGTNLQGATLTSDDPQNISVSVTSSMNTSLTASVTVKDTAELRTHVFHLFNGRGDIPIPVNLKLPTPTVEKSDVSFAANQAPTAYSAEDKTLGPVTVTGRFLQGLKLLPLGDKPLPTPTIDSVDPSGTSFKAKITIPKGSPNGTYSFAVGNAQNAPDPNEKNDKRLIKVAVGFRPAPTVKTPVGYGKDGTGEKPKVNPASGVTFTVDIKGTDLNDLRDTNPIQQDTGETPQFTIGPIEPVSATEVRVQMTAPAGAAANTPYHFTIFNKGSDASQPAPATSKFTIELQQQNAASIKNGADQSVTLASDKTATVTLTGENLEGAKLTDVPTGWTVTPDKSSNGTQLILKIATTNNITSETPLTFNVINLDKDHPAKVTLKIKPAPTP